MALEIGNTEVPKNSAEWVDLPVAENMDMHVKAVHAYVINGNEDGPTLWIQGGIHGNEQGASQAVRDFILDINPTEISGAIIGVPVVNIWAFERKFRRTPVEHLGNHDTNRVFPGSPDGSFTEQLAHVVSTTALEHADYFIDCHSCGENNLLRPGYQALGPSGNREVDEKSLELAKISDFEHTVVFGLDESSLRRSFSSYLLEEQIPGIVLECGGRSVMYDWVHSNFTEAFENITRHIDLQTGSPNGDTDHQPIHHKLTSQKAPVGGFWEPLQDNFTYIEDGETLARITDLKGNVKAEIDAKGDGFVTLERQCTVIRPGDYCFHSMLEKDVGDFPLEETFD